MKGYNHKHGKGLQPYQEDGDAKDERNRIQQFQIETLPHLTCVNGRAIDVGCGNGRISHVLASHFNSVLSIDVHKGFDPRFNHPNVEFKQQAFEDVTGKFDLILFWGSFYLMSDYHIAIKHCESILNKEGIVVIADDKSRRSDRIEEPNKKVNYNLEELLKETSLVEKEEFFHQDYYRVTVICKP